MSKKEWHKQKHKKHKQSFVFIAILAVAVIVFSLFIVISEEKRWFAKAINCSEPYEAFFDLNSSLNELDKLLENAYEHKREAREAFNTVIVEKVKNKNWHDAEVTAQISITMPEELAWHLKDKSLKLFQTTGGATFLFEHKFKAQEEKSFEYAFDKKLSQEDIDSIKFSITENALLPFSKDKIRKEFMQGLADKSMRCVNIAILNCNSAYIETGKEKIEIKGRINDELCELTYSIDKKRYSCEMPFKAYSGNWKTEEVLRFCREDAKYTGQVTLV